LFSPILASALNQVSLKPGQHNPPAASPVDADAPVTSSKDNFVGSGLNLELTLKSGAQIKVALRQDGSGQIRDLQIKSDAPLSDAQLSRFKTFMTDLGKAVDSLFTKDQSATDVFAFASGAGIGDVELEIQQDNGQRKQRMEFEKLQSPSGRFEVNAEWAIFDRDSGLQSKHNLALNRQDSQTKSGGGTEYQWLLEQIKAGIDVMALPSESTGALNTQERESLFQFFSAGIHVLFEQTQKGMQTLQAMGASKTESQQFIDGSVSAMTGVASQKQTGGDASTSNGASGFKNLPDFQAHFSSQRNAKKSQDQQDEYQFAMEISQSSRWLHQRDSATATDKNSLVQNRRLLVQYEHVGNLQQFEFNWRHDEYYAADYINQVLQQTRTRTQDEINSQLITPNPGNQGGYNIENSHSSQTQRERNVANAGRSPIRSLLGSGYRV